MGCARCWYDEIRASLRSFDFVTVNISEVRHIDRSSAWEHQRFDLYTAGMSG